jgi:hypothetical protein
MRSTPSTSNAGGDGRGRRVFALVSGEAELGGVGRLEGGTERHGIDPAFGRVHADADDPIHAGGIRASQLDQPLNQFQPGGRPESPVDVGDQQTRDAGFGFGGSDPFAQAGDDGSQVLTARQVPSGREESLTVDHTMGGRVDNALVAELGPVVPGSQGRLH